jgi:nucleoside-diphosphate-sugar epimerase
MRVLLTGASGLLGHHLITALHERGHIVRALVLPNEDATHLEARHVAIYRGDVREPETLLAPMQRVELVFHLAGMMGVWRPMKDYWSVNVTGVENVCRAALAAGVERLIHISSWTVYGMDHGQAMREDAPLAPFQEPYAVTKTEGDKVVQRLIAEEQLPAVIIRPGTFFGPGDRLHFGRMADRVRGGKGLVIGSGRNALPFVYVTDVVQGLMLAAEKTRAVGQAYNITNDEPMTQEAFLRAIAEELGVAPPRLHVPYDPMYAAAAVIEKTAIRLGAKKQPVVTRLGVKLFGSDNRHSVAKARAELGYNPRVTLREGVRLAAEWHRTQGQSQQTQVPTPVPAATA